MPKHSTKSTRFANNDSQPASKGDVRQAQDELAAATASGFNNVESRLTSVESRLEHIEETMATKEDLRQFATKEDLKQLATKNSVAAVLAVVEENNQLLKEIRRLPERVDRLERSVFRR